MLKLYRPTIICLSLCLFNVQVHIIPLKKSSVPLWWKSHIMKRNFRAEEFGLISAAGKQHSSKYEIGTFILSEGVHSKLHLLIHLFVLKMLPCSLFPINKIFWTVQFQNAFSLYSLNDGMQDQACGFVSVLIPLLQTMRLAALSLQGAGLQCSWMELNQGFIAIGHSAPPRSRLNHQAQIRTL